MIATRKAWVILTVTIHLTVLVPDSRAARIGVDNVHGASTATYLASGSSFDLFRAELAAAGHVMVPLDSFGAADLAGLDGLIVRSAYSTSLYTPAEEAAIQAFTRRAVFLGDSSLFTDTPVPPEIGSDRPLTFGDNRRLLLNLFDYIAAGGGTAFLADGGTSANVANFNPIVAPYGVSFALNATEGSGWTVSGFQSHPLTAGVSTVGVDFHTPLTVTNPSLDLTTGSGNDNILAVFPVPEPSGLALLAATAALLLPRRRKDSKGSGGRESFFAARKR